MKESLKPVAAAMAAILTDPRSNRIERIEAAKVLLSCHGCLIPEVNENFLSVRQIVQLRNIKQQIVISVIAKQKRRQKQNRRAYLRRRIKELEEKQNEQSN